MGFTILISAGFIAQSTKFTGKNGIAIKDYDPVAYFSHQKALKENEKYTFDWSGSKWEFVSQNNLDRFKLTPKKMQNSMAASVLMESAKTISHPPTLKFGQM